MSKVTSKLQVTIPKAIAEAHGIKPGSEIFFESFGGVLMVRTDAPDPDEIARRLREFDASTERIRERQRLHPVAPVADESVRDWTREELYEQRLSRYGKPKP